MRARWSFCAAFTIPTPWPLRLGEQPKQHHGFSFCFSVSCLHWQQRRKNSLFFKSSQQWYRLGPPLAPHKHRKHYNLPDTFFRGGGRFWKVEAGNELRWELVTSFQNRSSSFCFHTTDISDFQTSALVSESPSRVFSRSDPVGPALLSAEPDQDHHGGSTGLRVLWSRSAGHVDWYEVTVEDSTTGVSRSTRVSGTATPQSGFSSLVPGTRYTVSVLASSGGKNATSVRTSAATGEKRYFFVIF